MLQVACMLGAMILLFTLIPALELYLIFKIGPILGAGNTLILVILTGIVGAVLAKSQGLSILARIQKDINKGNMPAIQFIHGLLVFGGGLLLMTPGFMTDALGFTMVIPGPRHLLVDLMKRYFNRAIKSGHIHFAQIHVQHFEGRDFGEQGPSTWQQQNDSIEVDFKEKP